MWGAARVGAALQVISRKVTAERWGGSSASAVNERLQGQLPLVLHGDARSVFFLGLATGSLVWGRRAARDPAPLRTYAWLEVGIAVSGVVLGALILGESRMPLLGALLVVAFFALFHGHAHGTELAPGQNAMLYSLGFVICTGVLHGIGIGMGLVHRWGFGRIALRGAGSLVMVGGLYFLWSAIA